jgi:hypothetical protein
LEGTERSGVEVTTATSDKGGWAGLARTHISTPWPFWLKEFVVCPEVFLFGGLRSSIAVASGMAGMEPTKEMLTTFESISDIMKFLEADIGAEPYKTIIAATGAGVDTKPSLLALVKESEIEDTFKGIEVNLIAKSTMRHFFHICQLVAGVAVTRDAMADLRKHGETLQREIHELKGTRVSSTAEANRVKLNTILSQTRDTEITVMDAGGINMAYARYQAVYGAKSIPPPDAEPTVEQLSGLAHVLGSKTAPYVDFAVWGPHGHRIQKRLKLSALQLKSDGTWGHLELNGPADIDMWTMSYDLLSSALIMLDVVDLGPLQMYKKMITGYHKRYGHTTWHIVYQADTRMRLEQMDRLLRAAAANHDRATREGKTSDFKPERPWNSVWLDSINDGNWWRYELEEPALLHLNRKAATSSSVGGDARVGFSNNVVAEADRGSSLMGEGPPAKRRATGDRRVHETTNGKYTHNRKGKPLCPGFNSGSCKNTVRGSWCGDRQEHVHLCDRCLGNHTSLECGHKDMPQTHWAKKGFRKGKGKGKGKGKF